MSSSILKGGYVVVSPSNYVTIDSNELIKQRLEELKEKQISVVESEADGEGADGFVEGLDSLQVARLVGDFEGEEDVADSPNIIRPVDMEKLVNEANAEAERILAEARAEAARIMEEAKRDGYNQGYQQGESAARGDFEKKSIDLQREYDSKINNLDNELQAMKDELEPKLVDKLADIYAHVIGINLEDSKEVVLFLLNKALGGMDSNKHYIIHVSEADFDTVKASAPDISKNSGIVIDNLEIIEDHSLEKNGCMIESDAGIFEVGLDTQLRLLNKQLKILSMQPND